MQSAIDNIEKTTRTAREITESQQRAFEAFADNFLSFQRRNAEAARGWSDLLKLQESNVRVARDLLTSGMRFTEVQQRNARFAQEWMSYGFDFWRDQAESNVRVAEVVARSAAEQQEGFRKLAGQWADVYESLFSSWDSYATEGLRDARKTTGQATRQGLRLAEEAVEQTERTVRQADPNRLPIEGYDELNVSEVSAKLDGLTVAELKKVQAYERRNKNRETVIEQIGRKIKATS